MVNMTKKISRTNIMVICAVLVITAVFFALSIKTKAAGVSRTYNGSELMYVNLGTCGNSWWTNSGCYHRAYFFGTNTAWANLNATSDSGIYSITVPAGTYTNIILCRCSTSTTTWSSGTVYNQTGDIPLVSSSNYISYFGGEWSTAVTWGNYGNPTPTPSSTATSTTPVTGTGEGLQDKVEDGTILHAFNWSYSTIKNNLANIAAAGFTTIQTSPVQQPKDYSSSYSAVSGNWWKLYQPISFSIANNSWLGNSTDFTSLCNAAHSYGIKIVCDIVANHMANNGTATSLAPDIANYESQLYNNYSTYFHSYYSCSDSSIEGVVYGNIGMPDLNTSNSYVQERVINLLKECIDCGADGFRFDAAKHVETANDGSYASNFWPNVIGTAKSYSSGKGRELFCYGEILNTVGSGRSFSGYTPYMRVTDNKAGDSTLYGVYSNNVTQASSSYFFTGLAASNLVLWTESHDTYMGNSGSMGLSNTSGVSTSVINRAWAIIASRADAVPLYLARPDSATMGNKGSSVYSNTEVAKVNFFHNKFDGTYEYLSYSGSVVMNERYSTLKASGGGAVLVNLNGSSTSVTMTAHALGNGTYTDKMTGNTFTVSGGTLTGTIGSTGIAVIY